jgi:Tfp pilus assembly protein PilF
MAYTLYLQAQHLRKYGGTEDQQEANELLERAIAIEPEYSEAWSMLAWRHQQDALAGRISFEEANAKSSKAFLDILEFDPDYAPAHAVLGVNALQTGDLDTAAAYIQRAYELNPTDATVLFNIANLLSLFGRLEEAIQVMEYLVTLDPVYDGTYRFLGEIYSESAQPGHAAKARDAMRTAMRLNPGSSYNRLWFGMLLLAQGEADDALEIASQTEDPEWWPGQAQMLRAMALYTVGRQKEYAMAVSGLAAPSGAYAFLNAAYVSAWAGEADQCFALLNLQLEKDPSLLYGSYWASPFFARVRDDPRWQPIREQLGLSPEQIAAIDFEVRLPK